MDNQGREIAGTRAAIDHKVNCSGEFIPYCSDEDGSYNSIQCHPLDDKCWCVDNQGREIAGTRAAIDHKVNCSGEFIPYCSDEDDSYNSVQLHPLGVKC